ncbi:MAG: molybdopterin-dependent oxidoreductase [Acidimicrobiia bacterium]|nr:molybdopterin-dependent oxidoreductase [Acidimicrobiia bacterium]
METRTDDHLLANERAVENVRLDHSPAVRQRVEVARAGDAQGDHAPAGLIGPESEAGRRCDAAFFAEYSIDSLARRSDAWLSAQGRQTQPMYRPADGTHYQPISWDEAFAVLARHLRATTPERTAFYTSNRTSNEASFLYHLFVREYGTNNLPDCTNMCHESSGQALHETIGIDKGTVPLEEFDAAQVILVIGQNPGLNNPQLAAALQQAKAAGASIVAINPLPPAGRWQLMSAPRAARPDGVVGEPKSLADRFLQIRVGGDLALFQLINAGLIERGAVDTAFVDKFCSGYESLHDALDGVDRSTLLEATGLTADEVDSLTDLLADSDRIVACWAMGLTQQRDAVAAIREVVNTLLLRGSFGTTGAGIGPVRGHSHVHGGRTPGLYDQVDQTFFDALDAEFGLSVPRRPGYDTVSSIAAMRRRDIDVFMAMGGNFAGLPRHRRHGGRVGFVPAHRAGVYQAEPFACDVRARGAHPAGAQPGRDRPNRRNQTVCDR